MIIGYLGPINSYSFFAAEQLKDNTDILKPFADFESLFKGLDSECDYIVAPIENSIEGSVSVCVDLILESEAFVLRELVLPIRHALISLKDVSLKNIKRIYTHPQAYSQCRKFIKREFPDCEIMLVSSTAKATEMLDETSLAIANSRAKKDTQEIVQSDIQDYENNLTRFLALCKYGKDIKLNAHAEKISVVFETENRPGGLLDALTIFYKHNINMTKIESRPSKTALGRYIFYVDFIGRLENSNISQALEELNNSTCFFKLLGNY